jgi:hypothetical protein
MMAKNDKKNEYFGLGEAWVEVIAMATTLRDNQSRMSTMVSYTC